MIDLHMHTLASDGVLLPAELTRRAEIIGCRCIAITDHVDLSNVKQVAESITAFGNESLLPIRVIPGVEITHVAPKNIGTVAEMARDQGRRIRALSTTVAEILNILQI